MDIEYFNLKYGGKRWILFLEEKVVVYKFFFKMFDNCIFYIVVMYIVKVVLYYEMIKV